MQDKSTYILDTSVLLHSSSSIRSFGSKNVVLPYTVLEEIDSFKTRDDELGRNARQVVRELNELRKVGNLIDGVQLNDKGGTLYVVLNDSDSASSSLNMSLADDRILNTCLQLKGKVPKVTLVTKDINLSVKADALGVLAKDFTSDKLVEAASDIFTGTSSLEVEPDIIDRAFSAEGITSDEIKLLSKKTLYVNQYVTLTSPTAGSKSCLIRITEGLNPVKVLKSIKPAWGCSPKNREQMFAFDALMDPTISLVTLVGKAGSGKTIISLACALSMVRDLGMYDRLIVSRPIQPMGNDIGYLPGLLSDKMSPWMGPIKDSVMALSRDSGRAQDLYQEMIDLGILEVEALTYIRGRSIPNSLFLLDEAQNLSKTEIKAIVSRMGENSKLIITGDIMQIDTPYLDPTNTGLAHVVEKFKEYGLAAHITLQHGERSALATIASLIL